MKGVEGVNGVKSLTMRVGLEVWTGLRLASSCSGFDH